MPGGTKAKQVAESSESTEVLCSFRRANSGVAKKTPLFSRGHDFVRLFGTTLAADRSRSANYGLNTVAYLRCIRDYA